MVDRYCCMEYGQIFVDASWLNDNIGKKDLVIIDCRYDLMEPEKARRRYRDGHIPGAFRLDMEEDLAGEVGLHGGRHPFPDRHKFAEKLMNAGVGDDTTVVGYDDDLSGAARLWFLLRYFGHQKVRILDGGIASWIELGYKLTTQPPVARQRGVLNLTPGHEPVVDSFEIARRLPDMRIVDSRSRPRYLGEFEPIDRKAGHIPGARNVDYLSVQERPGKLKPPEELVRIYSSLGRNPVVYCGSGVTSCVNYVAMKSVGLEPILYAGSWSDWISYENNPVASGDEESVA